MSDLIPLKFSNKVASPLYSGNTYSTTRNSVGPPAVAMSISLVYASSTGEWSIARTGTVGSNVFNGGATSGFWTTTPTTAYEFYMTATTTAPSVGPVPGPTYNGVPVATWTPISGSTTIARLEQPSAATQGSFETDFTLLLRKVGTTTPEITTIITMFIEYAA